MAQASAALTDARSPAIRQALPSTYETVKRYPIPIALYIIAVAAVATFLVLNLLSANQKLILGCSAAGAHVLFAIPYFCYRALNTKSLKPSQTEPTNSAPNLLISPAKAAPNGDPVAPSNAADVATPLNLSSANMVSPSRSHAAPLPGGEANAPGAATTQPAAVDLSVASSEGTDVSSASPSPAKPASAPNDLAANPNLLDTLIVNLKGSRPISQGAIESLEDLDPPNKIADRHTLCKCTKPDCWTIKVKTSKTQEECIVKVNLAATIVRVSLYGRDPMAQQAFTKHLFGLQFDLQSQGFEKSLGYCALEHLFRGEHAKLSLAV